MDKEEEFTESDVGTLEDVSSDTGEMEEKRPIGKIKPNMIPRVMWSDHTKTKFKSGDLVNIYNGKTTYKISGLGKEPLTYDVMASGMNSTTNVKEEDTKLAGKDAKWSSYWEENDPFKVKGIKISCPSNDAMK